VCECVFVFVFVCVCVCLCVCDVARNLYFMVIVSLLNAQAPEIFKIATCLVM